MNSHTVMRRKDNNAILLINDIYLVNQWSTQVNIIENQVIASSNERTKREEKRGGMNRRRWWRLVNSKEVLFLRLREGARQVFVPFSIFTPVVYRKGAPSKEPKRVLYIRVTPFLSWIGIGLCFDVWQQHAHLMFFFLLFFSSPTQSQHLRISFIHPLIWAGGRIMGYWIRSLYSSSSSPSR